MKPGDNVLVHDQDVLRGFWKLVQVEKLITGLVRGAMLRLPAKNGRQTTLQCPIQLLYHLEISSECQPSNRPDVHVDTTAHLEVTPQTDSTEEKSRPRSRPQRQSASRARDGFKE